MYMVTPVVSGFHQEAQAMSIHKPKGFKKPGNGYSHAPSRTPGTSFILLPKTVPEAKRNGERPGQAADSDPLPAITDLHDLRHKVTLSLKQHAFAVRPTHTKLSPLMRRWIPSSTRIVALGAFPRGTGCLQASTRC